jgi:membrane protein required for beta-lactamase induction
MIEILSNVAYIVVGLLIGLLLGVWTEGAKDE